MMPITNNTFILEIDTYVHICTLCIQKIVIGFRKIINIRILAGKITLLLLAISSLFAQNTYYKHIMSFSKLFELLQKLEIGLLQIITIRTDGHQ